MKSIAESVGSEFIIEGGTLIKYIGSDADVVIPSTASVIGEKAFYKRSVGRVVYPTARRVSRIMRSDFAASLPR